ncbi:MAG: sulfatase [Opitutaceae bacterium]|jgi:arylsulfatase A-like enzyme|nr:sulfatase [Opitutaceae bacterium]
MNTTLHMNTTLPSPSAPATSAPATRPNILYLHAHDMGRYNSIYGYPARTPNMQRLAATGMTFANAHAAAPTCSPSRAALLTGQTAHQAGILGLVHRGFDLKTPEHHLASWLRAHGYRAILCGVQHEFRHELEPVLYDQVYNAGPSGPRDTLTADAAIRCIQDSATPSVTSAASSAADTAVADTAPVPKPWFMSVGFFWPHRAYLAAPPAPPASPAADADDAPLPPPPDPLPATTGTRRDMADYYASVAHTDAAIGRILDALEHTGQDRNTLVLLTTDHGIAFPLMKCRLTAHGTGVTLVIRHPGHTPAGLTSRALVSHLDIYPTLCDLAAIPTPPWAIGHTLATHLKTATGPVRDDLFAEVNYHAAAEPMRGIRTEKFNYIKLFDTDPRPPLANIDSGRAKDDWLATGAGARPRDPVQLYDLERDPCETRNVAAQPEYAAVLADMERRLAGWMQRTADPLLSGPLVPPPGARINPRESLSPEDTLRPARNPHDRATI